jgi:hypothetical protein
MGRQSAGGQSAEGGQSAGERALPHARLVLAGGYDGRLRENVDYFAELEVKESRFSHMWRPPSLCVFPYVSG